MGALAAPCGASREEKILDKGNACGQFPVQARLRRTNGEIRGTPDLKKLETFPDVFPAHTLVLRGLPGKPAGHQRPL